MKDDILSYLEMCTLEGLSLQRGMNFKPPPARGIILMSRRKNAPYNDQMSADESEILYEGHDAPRTRLTPDPKSLDQPRVNSNGAPTQNGLFADWVDNVKANGIRPASFQVYEKMRQGTWTDRGPYLLVNYEYRSDGIRNVFKFSLKQSPEVPYESPKSSEQNLAQTRQIPSAIKHFVYKRDGGKCVMCGSTDQLHFDHDFPYSKGGTSILPENVRILCARHNLEKSAKIQ